MKKPLSIIILICLSLISCGVSKEKRNTVELPSEDNILEYVDISLDPIFFEKNSSETNDFSSLKNIPELLIKNKKLKVKIIGNAEKLELDTDTNLSIKRAVFVKKYFFKYGIEESRITLIDLKNMRQKDDDGKINNMIINKQVDIIIY